MAGSSRSSFVSSDGGRRTRLLPSLLSAEDSPPLFSPHPPPSPTPSSLPNRPPPPPPLQCQLQSSRPALRGPFCTGSGLAANSAASRSGFRASPVQQCFSVWLRALLLSPLFAIQPQVMMERWKWSSSQEKEGGWGGEPPHHRLSLNNRRLVASCFEGASSVDKRTRKASFRRRHCAHSNGGIQ